ncbi:MAG TPA: hypothetical protein VFL13_11450, partial [Candidatus Baltobacteraceae bacterium]|nr:hypothetical protein [Candidatus Baltobacteraceae bacterium]
MFADRRALDVEELTARVESLLRAANSRAADELVQTLVTLYGEGLRRVLDALAGAPGGADVLDR